jgi:hypothetical protein
LQSLYALIRLCSPASEPLTQLLPLLQLPFPQSTFPIKIVFPIMPMINVAVQVTQFAFLGQPKKHHQQSSTSATSKISILPVTDNHTMFEIPITFKKS